MSESMAVAAVASEDFAMPLSVMARSISENTGIPLELFVLDAGLSPESRRKLTGSCGRVSVRWLRADPGVFSHLPRGLYSFHVNQTTYLRLLMGDLLPADLAKVIFIDADCLVLGDLGELWKTDLEGRCIAAVQDFILPFMDAAVGMANYREAAPYVERRPLPGFAALGIPGEARYFNAGVLCVDLKRWREKKVGLKARAHLEAHQKAIRFADQDALNVVLWDDWLPLPPVWNFMPMLFRFPDWRKSAMDESSFREARLRPQIVHFAGAYKPWRPGYCHSHHEEYFRYLDLTAWAGAARAARFDRKFLQPVYRRALWGLIGGVMKTRRVRQVPPPGNA